jgi:predicted nucleic acid-binding protein
MIVDTSFILALLSPPDPNHKEARRLFEKHAPLSVQQPVLTECLQVVHYSARKLHGAKHAHAETRSALRAIMETLRLHVMAVEDFETALSIFMKHDTLTLVDACGVADARPSGGLLTFDKSQKRLADRL